MDDNVKDVLLVLVGGLLSIFASTLTTYFQNRYERQVARRERKEKHFDEVQEYLYANAAVYAATVDYLISVTVGMFNMTPAVFADRINPLLNRAASSRFNGIPNIAITKNTTTIDKLAKFQDYMLECKILLNILGAGASVSSDVTTDHQKKLEEMNMLIADVVEDLEKEIDQ